MEECVDGEYQNFKAAGGDYVREHFFGKYPELKEMVANMSDEEIWRLNRGGLDAIKVFAAYDRAVNTEGRPTVILAKTIKGFGMGEAGEGKMTAHQAKKLDGDDLRAFRDRFNIPVSDEEIDKVPSTSRRKTARKCVICMNGARRSAAICRRVTRMRRGSRFRRWTISRNSWTVPASARSPRPWRSCAC